MPNKTPIEWTDYSSNPIFAYDRQTNKRGWHCVHVSEGCRNCYAEAINKRFGTGLEYSAQNASKIEFRLSEKECAALKRLNAKHPSAKVFLGDMLDIFQHGPTGISDQLLNALFDVLEECTNLIFQSLTKHPERAKGYLTFRWGNKAPAHIWIGISVEDQKRADERLPLLINTPAAIRWLSVEPLLEKVDLSLGPDVLGVNDAGRSVDWVVVGGESGPRARMMRLGWARSVVEQCRAASIPVFVKQLGSKPFSITDRISYPNNKDPKPDGFYRFLNDRKGGKINEWPNDLRIREFPKVDSTKAATAREV